MKLQNCICFFIYCYEILHKYYLSLMLCREKRLATVAKKKNNGLMIHFENWSVDSKKSKEGDKKKRKWDLVVTSWHISIYSTLTGASFLLALWWLLQEVNNFLMGYQWSWPITTAILNRSKWNQHFQLFLQPQWPKDF